MDIAAVASDFQKLVWAEIDKIPYGSTITYKEIAIKIGKPQAVRAVAMLVVRTLNPSSGLATESYAPMEK